MRRQFVLKLALCFAAAAVPCRSAEAVIVDGNLSDWSVTIGTGASPGTGIPGTNGGTGGSTYVGLASTPGYQDHHLEDTADFSNSYFVGPNHGGQNYDAELLAIAVQGTKLHIAIMSGQRPDNKQNATVQTSDRQLFAPGDIRIETNNGTFGIEVGGGGGQSWGTLPSQVNDGDPGTTYRLNSSGFTIGGQLSNTAIGFPSLAFGDPTGLPIPPDPVGPMVAAQKAGTVWKTLASDWIDDPIPPPTPTQFQIGGGTMVGAVDDYVFKFAGLGEHSVIELTLDFSLFSGPNPIPVVSSVAWSPSCGNDVVIVTPDASPELVPEASSVVIWLSLCALGIVRARKMRRSSV